MKRALKKICQNEAWELLAEELFKSAFPKHLYIEPTNDCNLRCSICPSRDKPIRNGYLDFALLKKIIQEISPQEAPEKITLHKNGEPLLHPELVRMIKLIKQTLPSVQVSFSTSGVPLNTKKASEILEAQPDQIFISLGNLLTHAKNGRKRLFNRTAKNAKDFLTMRRKLGEHKPRITLRLLEKKGGLRRLAAKNTKWAEMADEIEIRPYHTWCGYFPRTYPLPPKRLPCLSLWTTLAINWDGPVSICSLDHARAGIVGNIKKSKLKDIWQGSELRYFRQRHLQNNYQDLAPCEHCSEWRHNTQFWTKANIKKAKALSNKSNIKNQISK